MTATVLYPTVVALAQTTVAAAIQEWGAPVGYKTPSPLPGVFATVDRFGGTQRTEISEDATIGVECWAGDPATAEAMAQAARYALQQLANTVADGVTVYRVSTVAAPRSLPHPSGKPRYTFSVAIHVRGVAL